MVRDGINLDPILRAWDAGQLLEGLDHLFQAPSHLREGELFPALLSHYRGGTGPVKILIVSHSADFGGAERCLIAMVESLAELFELHVLFPADGPLVEKIARRTVHTHVLPYPWWIPDCAVVFSDAFQQAVVSLGELIRSRGIEAVITNTSVVACGAVAARLANIPHLWYIHEIFSCNYELFPVVAEERLYPVLDGLSDLILGSKTTVASLVGQIKKALVVPLQLCLDQGIAASMERLVYPFPQSGILLSVGGINHTKGVGVLLEAMGHLVKRHPKVRLLLAGAEGSASQEVRAKIAWYGLQNHISFLGLREDIQALYHQAEVVVQPSLCESFGLAILEAAASGVPTVATRVGGPEEILDDGVTGLLVPPNDPLALSRAICLLLENKQVAREISTRARATLPHRFHFKRFRATLRYWLTAVLCRQLQQRDKPSHTDIFKDILADRVAKAPIPLSFEAAVADLVQFGDLAEQEAKQRLAREMAHPGVGVTDDVRTFGATPYLYDEHMEAVYRKGEGYLFDLYVGGASNQREIMGRFVIQRLAKLAVELGVVRPRLRILMLGDGIGTDSIRLLHAGYSIDFFDFAGSKTYELAHRRLMHHYPQRVCFKNSLESLPEAGYDAIVSFEVLEHLPDPLAAMATMARLLRERGVAFVTDCFSCLKPKWPTHLNSNKKYSGVTPFLFIEHGLRLEWFNRDPLFKPYEFRKVASAHAAGGHFLLMIPELREEIVRWSKEAEQPADYHRQITERLQQAVIILNKGYIDAARAVCDEILAYAPGSYDAWLFSGMLLNRLGKKQEALAAYKKSIEIKPDFAEGHAQLGALLRELGRSEEANSTGMGS